MTTNFIPLTAVQHIAMQHGRTSAQRQGFVYVACSKLVALR